jgi:hypothetical protein
LKISTTYWKNATYTILKLAYKKLIMLVGGTIERSNASKCFLLAALVVFIVFLGIWQVYRTEESAYKIFNWENQHLIGEGDSDLTYGPLMDILMKNKAYSENDFVNDVGIIPPYWTDGTIPKHPSETTTESLGPCFLSRDSKQWDKEVKRSRSRNFSDYPTSGLGRDKNDWANYCLPGFLIIGAGKCGTSVCFYIIFRSFTVSFMY